MKGRIKKFTFIAVSALVIALLLGPPLAIAGNLPTVCNIFHKKAVDKEGTCAHRAMFSKVQDKSFEAGAVLLPSVGFETNHFLIIQTSPTSIFSLFGKSIQFNPLRC
jgi:hypothetical protein